MSVSGGHVGFYTFFHKAFLLQPIGNEVFNLDEFQIVLLGFLDELRHTCHRTVFIQDFDECGSWSQSGKTSQVNSGLGVSAAAKHTAVLGIERIDVAGTTEVSGFCLRIGQPLNCCGTVVGADSRGAAFQLIDRHSERCAQHRSVLFHLMGQFQFPGTLHGDGSTKYAAPFTQHEVHLLGRNQFRRCDEVALVLTVFIIHHNDKLSLAKVLNGCFYSAKLYHVRL